MVYKQIVSVDGQSSERERQIDAVQWTVRTLSIDGPPTKSSVISSSVSADDEISELERTSELIKDAILCNLCIFFLCIKIVVSVKFWLYQDIRVGV